MCSVDWGQVRGTLSVGESTAVIGNHEQEESGGFCLVSLLRVVHWHASKRWLQELGPCFFLTYPSKMLRMFMVLDSHLTDQRQRNSFKSFPTDPP